MRYMHSSYKDVGWFDGCCDRKDPVVTHGLESEKANITCLRLRLHTASKSFDAFLIPVDVQAAVISMLFVMGQHLSDFFPCVFIRQIFHSHKKIQDFHFLLFFSAGCFLRGWAHIFLLLLSALFECLNWFLLIRLFSLLCFLLMAIFFVRLVLARPCCLFFLCFVVLIMATCFGTFALLSFIIVCCWCCRGFLNCFSACFFRLFIFGLCLWCFLLCRSPFWLCCCAFFPIPAPIVWPMPVGIFRVMVDFILVFHPAAFMGLFWCPSPSARVSSATSPALGRILCLALQLPSSGHFRLWRLCLTRWAVEFRSQKDTAAFFVQRFLHNHNTRYIYLQ